MVDMTGIPDIPDEWMTRYAHIASNYRDIFKRYDKRIDPKVTDRDILRLWHEAKGMNPEDIHEWMFDLFADTNDNG